MPELRFYNSLTHRVERFEPLDPPRVTMYNCGPTVYDFAHIGNFKTFLFSDVLRRVLEFCGHRVAQVMNLTDVGHMSEDQLLDGGGEDKMQLAAQRLKEARKAGNAHAGAIDNPDDPHQVAAYYIQRFLEDARQLGLKVADEYPKQMPRATQHVDDMQAMIQRLIERGHAYVADGEAENGSGKGSGGDSGGAVYFAVGSFADYGQLSGNTLDQLRGGAGGRVQAGHTAGKRHPADFLLWKRDPRHLMKWDSPWGVGYPGWHIECSAMARACLGRDEIDIHTGGEDNIFPHHECEIAQSRGASGKERFARLWMHARHLMVEGEKMSKSKGNFFSVRDILDGAFSGRSVDPAVLRFEMIKANYRTQTNFTRQGLEDSARFVERFREAIERCRTVVGEEVTPAAVEHPRVGPFVEALADDLNMAAALGVVHPFVSGVRQADDAALRSSAADDLSVLLAYDRVLGVGPRISSAAAEAPGPTQAWVGRQCAALDSARAAKDYAAADALRAALQDAGYEVKTTPDGTLATRKLA